MPRAAQAGEEIPFDETHLHYGKGQTEAAITLTPGKHKLTLQFANALHKRRVHAYTCLCCMRHWLSMGALNP